jgi:hypothetical protein
MCRPPLARRVPDENRFANNAQANETVQTPLPTIANFAIWPVVSFAPPLIGNVRDNPPLSPRALNATAKSDSLIQRIAKRRRAHSEIYRQR